jgi:hypothetical protein
MALVRRLGALRRRLTSRPGGRSAAQRTQRASTDRFVQVVQFEVSFTRHINANHEFDVP